MLTALPVVLAVLATLLMAIVIFAPAPVPARVTLSYAPPLASPQERWEPPPPPFEPLEPSTDRRREPNWPLLLDPRAAGCDAAARLALVEALASVRTAWATELLRGALADESSPAVREAIAFALAESGPRVQPAGLA